MMACALAVEVFDVMKNGAEFNQKRYKENLESFKETTYEKVKEIHIQRFPYNDFLYYEYKED